MHGKTIGIVGAGRIGQATARRARGFGMKIIYWGLAATRSGARARHGACLAGATSDGGRFRVASSAAECRDATDFDAQFALMKPTAFIINTACGAVIDEKLVRALKKSVSRARALMF